MTDDELITFLEDTARPALQRYVLFQSKYRLSREDIEDIVQEALIRFLNVTLASPKTAMAWLKATAYNLMVDQLRKPSTRGTVPLDESFPSPMPDHGLLPQEAEVLQQEAQEAFNNALLQLHPHEKEVLDQLFTHKTQAEIAHQLDIPATTVAHYIRVAKAKLRTDAKLAAIYGRGE